VDQDNLVHNNGQDNVKRQRAWLGVNCLGMMLTLAATVAPAATASPSVHSPSAAEGTAERTFREAALPVLPRSRPGIEDLPPLRPLFPASAEVRLVLKLKERRLYVFQGEAIKASFPVAVGKPGWETPTGSFQVTAMLRNPGWTNPFTGEVMAPGADNPLGERWIGFWTDGLNDIGFHGTPNRESIGQAASHGCVRMFNEHIRQLFEWVDLGTSVTVEP